MLWAAAIKYPSNPITELKCLEKVWMSHRGRWKENASYFRWNVPWRHFFSAVCAQQPHFTQLHHDVHLAQVDNEVDRTLYISCHRQQVILFNTCIHPAQQQAAVCMLNHSSQLKSLLLGSKLPDSDLLLTSNPDKPLTSTFQSAVLLFPNLQNEGNAAFVTLTQPPV